MVHDGNGLDYETKSVRKLGVFDRENLLRLFPLLVCLRPFPFIGHRIYSSIVLMNPMNFSCCSYTHSPFSPYELPNRCIITNTHSTPFVCPLHTSLVLLRRADLETAEIAHSSLLRTSSQLLRPSSLVPLVLNRSYE